MWLFVFGEWVLGVGGFGGFVEVVCQDVVFVVGLVVCGWVVCGVVFGGCWLLGVFGGVVWVLFGLLGFCLFLVVVLVVVGLVLVLLFCFWVWFCGVCVCGVFCFFVWGWCVLLCSVFVGSVSCVLVSVLIVSDVYGGLVDVFVQAREPA
ncbi:hypothetical protein RA281_27365, partial [Pseudomonas syringae pv. tagetis]